MAHEEQHREERVQAAASQPPVPSCHAALEAEANTSDEHIFLNFFGKTVQKPDKL